MKVISYLARHRPRTFNVSYSPQYKTFITHHILSEPQHPLYDQRKLEYEKRKREGLWWHVTSGLDLSKSGVVRSWCRRRMRNAITQELKERGFDEHGKLMNLEALDARRDGLGGALREQKNFMLQGSLRIHLLPHSIPAKYASIRKEAGSVIDALLEGVKAEVLGAKQAPVQSRTSHPQRSIIPPPPSPPTSKNRRKVRFQPTA